MLHKEYDPIHEQRLLGAILIDNTIFDAAEMDISDFQIEKNRLIYETIQKMITDCEQVNIVSLSAKMPNMVSYISSLTSGGSANWQFYSERIKAAAVWNVISKLKLHISDWERDKDADEILSEIDKYIYAINNKSMGKIRRAGELLIDIVNGIQARRNNQGLSGISTGFKDLDDVTGGMRNAETIVIAARPSQGKTSLMINIATNCLLRIIPVGIFSLEMSNELLLYKMLSAMSGVEIRHFMTGDLTNSHFKLLMESAGQVNDMDLFIDDTPGIMISTLKNRARMMARRGARIIFIDYLTLIRHPDTKLPRWERVGDISKQLKQLAKELNMPIVILSQMNRLAEGSRPSLSELRNSGEIEEDSDVIIFIHGEREKENSMKNIICEKNRNWSIGECQLWFDKERARFSPILKSENRGNQK